MKYVIKWSGEAEEFDTNKLIASMQRANAELPKEDQAPYKILEAVMNSVLDHFNNDRILAEDLQELVEVALFQHGADELARQYCLGRKDDEHAI